ncbi:MAG: sulfurtransferase [Bacteroidota bacterium]
MKNETQSPLISAKELLHLKDDENLVLVDARFSKTIQEDYIKEHLKGALHVDLNAQLSNIKENAAHGGRHPLPSISQFAELLTHLGVSKASHVVIYDANTSAMAAARFWWMLKSAGHERVQVLNGGLKEAVEIGYPTSQGEETPKTVESYAVTDWQLPLTTITEVEKTAQLENHVLIDVRAAERYRGETEPIDLIAGHIPGAINIPLTGNIDKAGLFLSAESLREKYETILGDTPISNVTVHCGSGVTACHTLLAMTHAGFDTPTLYVGSWSEWSRNDKPIATNL